MNRGLAFRAKDVHRDKQHNHQLNCALKAHTDLPGAKCSFRLSAPAAISGSRRIASVPGANALVQYEMDIQETGVTR